MEIARNWVERRRVLQFLKGLDQGFESRHVALSRRLYPLMRPLLRCIKKRYACNQAEVMEMNLLSGWWTNEILEIVIIVVNQGISVVFAQDQEEAGAKDLVMAVATEVVGMGVVVLGRLLGQMLLLQLKGRNLQEERRLLLAMPTLSIQMKVTLNTHQ